jgi:cytoskeleton protein RodZ
MAKGNFGERMKRERELREVTLEEITSATRIGPRFLDALENEDWEKLPGGVFNRGFVRSIARYLGLDEEGFLAEYDVAHTAHTQSLLPKPEERIPSPPRWVPSAMALGAVALVLVLGAAGLYGWRYYHGHKIHAAPPPPAASLPPETSAPGTEPLTPTSTAPAATASESPETTPAPAQPSSAMPLPSFDLAVSANAPVHVSVDSDGYLVFDSDMKAGDTHHFFAVGDFQVSVSDSGAVLLELNGQAMPPIGPAGSSGTIKLNRNNLKQEPGGTSQP